MLKLVWLNQIKEINQIVEYSKNIKLIIRGNNDTVQKIYIYVI